MSSFLSESPSDAYYSLLNLGVKRVIFLDISAVGTKKSDFSFIKDLNKAGEILLGGGITKKDIADMDEFGVDAVLVGTALHNGELEVKQVDVVTREIKLKTKGNNEIIDITSDVEKEIGDSGLKNGTVTIFVFGSTAAVTTMEYEPGLKIDIPEALENIAPYKADYEHHKTWGDFNGSAHVRAALIGPDLTVPFNSSKLVLGTWQQIALLDFDTHPRDRRLVLQIMGVK